MGSDCISSWSLLIILLYWFDFVFTLAVKNGYWLQIFFFFAHNVTVCNSVTSKFFVTLKFSRRHGYLRPKHFDFCIEYKPIDRACQFHYHWLGLFGLLEEIGIESSILQKHENRESVEEKYIYIFFFHVCLKHANYTRRQQICCIHSRRYI